MASRWPRVRDRSVARLAVAIGALGVLGPLWACAKIAGLEDRTWIPADADAAERGEVGACGATAAPRWPDSKTARCVPNDAGLEATCVEAGAPGALGQDGEYRIDVPCYEQVGGVVRDVTTGLEWLALSPGEGAEELAVRRCSQEPEDGGPQWRLPNRLELLTLADFGRGDSVVAPPFGSVGPAWTGTPYVSPSADGGAAGGVFMIDFGCAVTPGCPTSQVGKALTLHLGADEPGGTISAWHDTRPDVYDVLCVRGVFPGVSPEGDAGVSRRFVARADTQDVIDDAKLGLHWYPVPALDPTKLWYGTWRAALGECARLHLLGRSWRVPSAKEVQTVFEDVGGAVLGGLSPLIPTPYSNGVQLWSSTPVPRASGAGRVYAFDAFDGVLREALTEQGLSYQTLCVSGPD